MSQVTATRNADAAERAQDRRAERVRELRQEDRKAEARRDDDQRAERPREQGRGRRVDRYA